MSAKSNMLRRIQVTRDPDEGVSILVPPAMVKEFEKMVKRGTAFGTQTSPDMKVFADELFKRDWMEGSYMREGACTGDTGQRSYTKEQYAQLAESMESAYQLTTPHVLAD